MGARVLDEHGKEVTPIMGSYGIGIERILTACVEQNHDEDGFWLPRSIAPFDVVLLPLSARDERTGVKFKDADLIGVPYRITMGSKKFAEGKVEVLVRHTKERADVDIAGILEHMQQT